MNQWENIFFKDQLILGPLQKFPSYIIGKEQFFHQNVYGIPIKDNIFPLEQNLTCFFEWVDGFYDLHLKLLLEAHQGRDYNVNYFINKIFRRKVEMIDIEVSKSGHTAIVKVFGGLTIQQAARLRDTLIDVINTCQSVAIDIGEMKDIDLSVLQLFCAGHKMALDKKKELFVDSAVPAAIRQIVIGTGYARRIGCSLDKNDGCMWIKEHTNE